MSIICAFFTDRNFFHILFLKPLKGVIDMQLDSRMLNQILTMNDEQLTSLINEIAKEAGIPPSQLGLNPQNIAGLRKALGGATTEDIQKMGCIYEEYRRQRHQK